MKYLKLFESFEDIVKICRKYHIIDYTINKDGSIDVDNYVWINNKNLTELPLKFNRINFGFDCSTNKLTSFEGSPTEVNSGFACSYNQLTSFKFAPKIIRGHFYCRGNNIKTFEYFPGFVKGVFECYKNPINEVWSLFYDTTKIELLNDFDIFRDEDTKTPAIVMNRLNDFLTMIGEKEVRNVKGYKNI